jgi:DNA recombination protein RmuC
MIFVLGFIFSALLFAGLFFLFRLMENSLSRGRAESRDGMQAVMNDIQVRLGTFQTNTEARLESIRGEVDKKLSETIAKNFKSFDAVSKRLEELQQVTGQVVSLSQGVRDLGKILESPKLRGAMGEFQLGEMLRQILPSDVYEEQFAIDGKSKETVDAVIKLKEGFLCIDSKFPLNNARALLEDNLSEEETKAARKAFANDVRNMAESISRKYIIPDRTLDFALMFIPA